MATADDTYSRVVGWAKIILPLCGLALLSTLFLLARNPSETASIPFAEIEQLAREQRMGAPRFSGLTEDGATVVITARSVRPDLTRPDAALVDTPRLEMQNPDGVTTTIAAPRGEISGRGRIAHFTGLVRVDMSTGYQMETDGMTAALDTGVLTTDGQLEIHGDFGRLTAGKAEFTTTKDGAGQRMVFTDGVKLVYAPTDR